MTAINGSGPTSWTVLDVVAEQGWVRSPGLLRPLDDGGRIVPLGLVGPNDQPAQDGQVRGDESEHPGLLVPGRLPQLGQHGRRGDRGAERPGIGGATRNRLGEPPGGGRERAAALWPDDREQVRSMWVRQQLNRGTDTERTDRKAQVQQCRAAGQGRLLVAGIGPEGVRVQLDGRGRAVEAPGPAVVRRGRGRGRDQDGPNLLPGEAAHRYDGGVHAVDLLSDEFDRLRSCWIHCSSMGT